MKGWRKETVIWFIVAVAAICSTGILTYLLIAGAADERSRGNAGGLTDECPPYAVCSDPGPGSGANGEGSGGPEDERDKASGHYRSAVQVIAIIDGEPITYADYEQFSVRYFGSSVLNHMLETALVEKEAEHLGIILTEADVEYELLRMMQGYESEEDFYLTMKKQLGMTKEQLLQDIRFRLLLEHIAIHDIEVTDEELNRYLEEHPEEIAAHTMLHIQQIPVSSLEEATEVIALLEEGTHFHDLAVGYGKDTLYPDGDLGWISANDPFVPYELLEYADTMKVGAISPPIELSDGSYVIIQLIGKQTMSGEERKMWEQQLRMELALSQARPLQEVLQDLRIKWNVSIIDPEFME